MMEKSHYHGVFQELFHNMEFGEQHRQIFLLDLLSFMGVTQ